ncbi:hypothetical protein HPP92_010924 [Vanilla planifolia]|uniref:Stachyose synthase n=1 Tax=Vanilla planifolia TaxID=51239 RepID=A0A835QUS3_VANPL|nr:hypothetical protein HPP92_010924 [Vanilla planifolia]
MDDLAVIKIVEGGIGLVHPDQTCDFYNSMHSYLSKAGVTGAKIDVIQALEYVGEEYGGRVELERAYYKGLTESMIRNFNGNGVISSMQQCNDFFFLGTEQVSMGRVGDDFWFQDPNGDPMGVYWLQGVHMIHCSYNSLWMGQMIRPDWDMFQSDHVCAKFHAGSRAICGGPVYLSDGLGGHNFDLIKKLVFPDGTIPRWIVFKNPLFDGKSVLKIWNFNKFGGVLGVFNCQGAGWDPKARRIKGFPDCYKPISGTFHVKDIEWDQNEEAAAMGKASEYAVYLNQTEQLLTMNPSSKAMEITLEPLSFEIINFMPVRTLRCGARFSPIGLTNMFNNGGTIVDCEEGGDGCSVRMKVKGEGRLLVYSDCKPRSSHVNGVDVGFEWLEQKKIMLKVSWMEGSSGVTDVVLAY